MRPIKLKVWDANKKSWVNANECIYIHPITGELEKTRSGLKIVEYTGLKDKNGKEIYEGDIVHFDDEWKNEFDDFSKDFEIIIPNFFEIKGYSELELGEDWSKLEVIGNIYENPELLN